MFCVVWDYLNSKLKDKQYKCIYRKPHRKVAKLHEIKILANPGLAWLGFEQPGPDVKSIVMLVQYWVNVYTVVDSCS